MKIRVTRDHRVPDGQKLDRCRRLPEFGPRILFFSGGSALSALSRRLKRFTHNSVHLITPFDSGGSSAKLRQAFAMMSVGDIRSRLAALADEDSSSNAAIYLLFTRRLSEDGAQSDHRAVLEQMIDGREPMMAAVPRPMRVHLQSLLKFFAERMDGDFDLRGASIGNLMLAGGFLDEERDIEAAVYLFSQLLVVRGVVRPIVDAHCHLVATLADATQIVGQHLMTGKRVDPIASPIADLRLQCFETGSEDIQVAIDGSTAGLIDQADLICFPMGSFYSSLIANLLPRGVGRAITERTCPKIFIPGCGHDPELLGKSLADTVEEIVRYIRRDAGEDVPVERIVNAVLLDENDESYDRALDIERITSLGIRVLRRPLIDAPQTAVLSDRLLTEFLISLS